MLQTRRMTHCISLTKQIIIIIPSLQLTFQHVAWTAELATEKSNARRVQYMQKLHLQSEARQPSCNLPMNAKVLCMKGGNAMTWEIYIRSNMCKQQACIAHLVVTTAPLIITLPMIVAVYNTVAFGTRHCYRISYSNLSLPQTPSWHNWNVDNIKVLRLRRYQQPVTFILKQLWDYGSTIR